MKKGTKTLILCIASLVVAAVLGFGLWFLLRDNAPAGNGNVIDVAWYNENGKEFTITTADELFEIVELSKYYNFEGQTIKLGADIVVNEGDAADWEFVLPKRRWEPIDGFAGTFDGQGHTISGLYGLGHFYGTEGSGSVLYTTGMFKNTQPECVIKNFKLVNSFFSSDLVEGVGSISSNGGGTFENIYSDAIILSYKSNNGGIIGLMDRPATITNCWYDGKIRVEGNVGRFTGGIVGRVMASDAQSKIAHCLNTADISSTVTNRGMNLGGLIGNIQSQARINIEDCLSVGDIHVDYESAVGGFVGNIESSSAVIVSNSYVKAEAFHSVIYNVTGTLTGAPLAHNESMITGTNAYKWTNLDFENYWALVEDGTPILKSYAEEIPSIEGLEKGFDTSWYDPVQSTYVINNAKELYGLAMLSYETDFTGKIISLGADIVLNEGKASDWETLAPEDKWFGIGTYGYSFEGAFDGQGHTISGLYMNTCENHGLFNDTGTSSVIMNLKMENSYFRSFGAVVGSITGRAAGVIQNVYSSAIVVGEKAYVGGMVGQAAQKKGLQMSNCWFDGKVIALGNTSSTKKTGGLIGAVRSESSIINCLNTGTVDATAFNYNQSQGEDPIVVPIVGGLVGYVDSKIPLTIRDSLNVGEVLYNEAATAAYASVVGYVDGDVTAYNVYAATESCSNHPLKQSISGQVCAIDTNDLKGIKAYQWTLLDFDKFWAVTKDSTPILKAFATETISLEGVKKEVDISWFAADKNTYVLDSREDLFGFRLMTYNMDFAGKTVKLGKNITLNTGDASKWAKSAPKYEWTPIGSQKYSFKGTFDGGMHSISGLYIKADTEFSGFFAVLTKDAQVKNLKILNSYYESSADFIGTIAGASNANLSNIYSNAIIVSSANTASGMVGRVTQDVKITNCWFDGSATVTGKGMPNRRAAGIVGFIYGGKVTISHCLNTGTVAAPNYVGTNSATSKAVVPMIGGIVGYAGTGSELVIEDSLNTGDVIWNPAATTGYGSIIGYADGNTTVKDTFATVESCETQALGKVTGVVTTYKEKDITGYAGYQWLNLNFDKYWAVNMNGTPILKSFATTVPSLAGIEKAFDISWYDASKNEYVLYDRADLNGLAYLSNSNDFAGKTIKLGANIVVNKDIKNPTYQWDPIGSKKVAFAGTFDGRMYTISGLYTNTDVECAGLFARTDKTATVKNLILKNSYFESTAMNLGSIAGIGNGTFDTIKSEAIVVGHNARIAGFVGMVSSKSTLNNCWYAGVVTNTGNGDGLRGTGGLVGVSYDNTELTIKNCLNTATVDASAYEYKQGNGNVTVLVGGLVGWLRSTATLTLGASMNTGEVKMSSKATNGYGSVVGYVDGKIVNTAPFYTTSESNPSQMNNYKTGLKVVDKRDIMGLKGYQWNVLDLDFVKYWTFVVDDASTTNKDEADTPILKAFASKVIDVTTVAKMFDYSWKEAAKGTAEDPYIIMDMADLYGLADLSKTDTFAGKYIKLGADIIVNEGNAADWATNAPEYGWTMIGTSGKSFAGTFDGDMHTISGLYVNTSIEGAGLFARTDKAAVVKNVILTNSYFESTAMNLGSIAGIGNGTFDTIKSDAIVVGHEARVGGLVGMVSSKSTLNNCWYAGVVTNTGNGDGLRGTGGLVAVVYDNSELTIKHCLNTATVDASAYEYKQGNGNVTVLVGGLVGWLRSTAKLTLGDSLNVGEVKASSAATNGYGSVIGYVDGSVVNEDGKFYTTAESNPSQMNNYKTGLVVVNQKDITGLYGYQFSKIDLDFVKYWTFVVDDESTTDKDEAGTPVLQSFASKVIDVATVTKLFDTSWKDKAAGTETDPYILSSMADLYGLAELAKTDAFTGKYFKLDKDIVINTGNAADWATNAPTYSWTPIGSSTNRFAGIFDGNNHTISGIYFKTGERHTGFFSATGEGAIVRNLRIRNSYMECTRTGSGQTEFGAVVGNAIGTFEKIYCDAIVTGHGINTGGILGYVAGTTTINEVWFDGVVTNTRTTDMRAGGIVGQVAKTAAATMTNCLNSGTINGVNGNTDDVCLGGLIGWVSGSANLTNCLSVGKINSPSAKDNIGSIAGHKGSGTEPITVNKVYGTKESHKWKGVKAATQITDITTIIGDKAKETLSTFDFANTWVTVKNNTPVLKTFADVVADTSWYTGNSSEYVLYDKGDLYGFASLSETNNFANITIKLGADIVVNSSDVSGWASAAPVYRWLPIGEFAGTFDGQGHTISGIYVNAAQNYVGLFSATAATAKVSNLTLTNSYIKNTSKYTGAIAGLGRGEFNNVHSTANVYSSNVYVGGLVGGIGSGTPGFTMTKSSFGGIVESSFQGDVEMGGLVGYINAPNTTINNCLFTGTVKATNTTKAADVGGIIGCLGGSSATGTMVENCLSLGTVTNEAATSSYTDAIIGFKNGKVTGTKNLYAVTTTATGQEVSVNNLKGAAAQGTLSGFDFENTWQIRENDTPILK